MFGRKQEFPTPPPGAGAAIVLSLPPVNNAPKPPGGPGRGGGAAFAPPLQGTCDRIRFGRGSSGWEKNGGPGRHHQAPGGAGDPRGDPRPGQGGRAKNRALHSARDRAVGLAAGFRGVAGPNGFRPSESGHGLPTGQPCTTLLWRKEPSRGQPADRCPTETNLPGRLAWVVMGHRIVGVAKTRFRNMGRGNRGRGGGAGRGPVWETWKKRLAARKSGDG